MLESPGKPRRVGLLIAAGKHGGGDDRRQVAVYVAFFLDELRQRFDVPLCGIRTCGREGLKKDEVGHRPIPRAHMYFVARDAELLVRADPERAMTDAEIPDAVLDLKALVDREMDVRDAKPHAGPMYSPDLDDAGTGHFRPRRNLEHCPGAWVLEVVANLQHRSMLPAGPGPRWTNFARTDPEPV
jgi:hypothetical protein